MSVLAPQIASHKFMEKALLESASENPDPLISNLMRELAIIHQKVWKALEAGEREAQRLPLERQPPPPRSSER